MKKSILALTLIGSLFAANSQADTLLGVYAGVQGWNMDADGGFADNTTLTNFDFDSENKSSFYVALEHPIPLVPNIEVRRTDMDTSGNTVLQQSFTFGGRLFSNQSSVLSDIELTTTDFILYYELFDNDLVSFDLGLNGKYVDGSLFVRSETDNTLSAREDFSGVVPMVYSKLAFGLPGTGFGVYAKGSFLSVDDHTLSDFEAAVTYDIIDNLAVDVSFQLGYRTVALELDNLDDIYTDLDFDGVFAGVEVHF